MGSEPTTLLKALERAARLETGGFTVWNSRGNPTVLSISSVYQRSREVGAALQRCGLQPGTRVGLAVNHPGDFIRGFFGIQWAGAVPVPIASPQNLVSASSFIELAGEILTMSRTQHLMVGDKMGAVLTRSPETAPWQIHEISQLVADSPLQEVDIHADDLAVIQCTSGSTSRPRGIRLSHRCLLANINTSVTSAVPLSQDDVVVSWLPLYHDLGLITGVLAPVVCAIPSVLMTPIQFMTEPHQWLRLITQHRGSVSWAPNQAYRYARATIQDGDLVGVDLSSWRVAGCAAEPIRPEVLYSFVRRFEPYGFRESSLVTAYGLAEFSLGATFSPPGRGLRVDRVDPGILMRDGQAMPSLRSDALDFTGCGFPLEGHHVRIMNESDQPLPERHVGQILLRGPSRSVGYETAATETLTRADEWLATGDRGYLADGELFVCGRNADVLRQEHLTLGAEDLEGILAAELGESIGALATFQDEGGGIVMVIEVPGRPGPGHLDSIQAQVYRGTSRAGVEIATLQFVPGGTLPRTTSGKIRRHRTRQLYREGQLKFLPR